MRIYRLTFFLAQAVLTGCIPIPHTSERFPAMRGHVVNAVTGQPISGAVVAVHDHPSTLAKTDTNGAFHFSKRRNYHLAVVPGICPTSWPVSLIGTPWRWEW